VLLPFIKDVFECGDKAVHGERAGRLAKFHSCGVSPIR
jgi:hypothetical protein